MYYLKIKDQKHRNHFKKFEIKLKLKKFIAINLLASLYHNTLITTQQKKLIYYQLLKKKKKNILNKIVRRCILTNRSKSIRFLKMSRLQSKELISFGIVPGYKKAVW
jgi:ribosomal protein S14